MIKHIFQSTRRPVFLIAFGCLLSLVFVLASCGSDSGSTSSTASSGGGTSASSTPTSVASVNIKESKGASGDVYSCDPLTLTVKKGDTVSFTNQTDEIQDFDQGDAQKASVDFKMNLNQSTTATFNTVGTFTIKSEKGATITVTVQ